MLLQTNSYMVPRDRRAEHARLLRRFRQALSRIGCDLFEVYEQVGANWGPGSTGRFVQIMRFRDRQHQQSVQAAERSDPGAQAIIAEFCDLINFPYQQQHGYFATGFYSSVLTMGPRQVSDYQNEYINQEEQADGGGDGESGAYGAMPFPPNADTADYDEEGSAAPQEQWEATADPAAPLDAAAPLDPAESAEVPENFATEQTPLEVETLEPRGDFEDPQEIDAPGADEEPIDTPDSEGQAAATASTDAPGDTLSSFLDSLTTDDLVPDEGVAEEAAALEQLHETANEPPEIDPHFAERQIPLPSEPEPESELVTANDFTGHDPLASQEPPVEPATPESMTPEELMAAALSHDAEELSLGERLADIEIDHLHDSPDHDRAARLADEFAPPLQGTAALGPAAHDAGEPASDDLGLSFEEQHAGESENGQKTHPGKTDHVPGSTGQDDIFDALLDDPNLLNDAPPPEAPHAPFHSRAGADRHS